MIVIGILVALADVLDVRGLPFLFGCVLVTAEIAGSITTLCLVQRPPVHPGTDQEDTVEQGRST